jgi:hypothetical protein
MATSDTGRPGAEGDPCEARGWPRHQTTEGCTSPLTAVADRLQASSWASSWLTEPDAFLAAFLATSAVYSVLPFDVFAVVAVLVVVVDLAMLRRVFRRSRVVCH